MKYLKYSFGFVIVCFALFGVKSYFFPKKPANLITEQQAKELEDLGIKVGKTDYISGAFGVAEGVPDIGEEPDHASSAPPSSFGIPQTAAGNAAPPFGSPIAATPAPPFGALAPAPAFAPPSTGNTAPPFAPISTIGGEAPAFSAPKNEATVYGEAPPFHAPAAPATPTVSPSTPEPAAPVFESPFSNLSPFGPSESTPVAIEQPAKESKETVTATPLFEETSVVETASFDTPDTTPVIPENVSPAVESPVSHQASFAPPKIKPLPVVEETVPAVVVQTNPIRQSASAFPLTNASALPEVPAFEQAIETKSTQVYASDTQTPHQYQQTSIRTETAPPAVTNPLSFDRQPTADHSVPVVSFADQPSAPPTPRFHLEPQPAERQPESIPGLRDPVVRYVKAQCALIDSGDVKAVCEGYDRLSQLNDHRELTAKEREYISPILNQLAKDVIFSPHVHVLELPYRVGPFDTIDSVAEQFDLSPETLMLINGMTQHRSLVPGAELKVVRGPFDLRISSTRNEMQLILGGLYAGSYRIGLGRELASLEGDFLVREKQMLDTDGQVHWIGLGAGRGLCAPERFSSVSPHTSRESLVHLAAGDMAELYHLLTAKSTATFTR